MVKRILIIVVALLAALTASAQYSQYNSLFRKALVIYEQSSDGCYYPTENRLLESISEAGEPYAYDKDANTLYVLTSNANCAITLSKDYGKYVKKNKDIPQLKDEALQSAIAQKSSQLQSKWETYNAQHRQHVQDSIAFVERKAYDDSVRLVQKKAADAKLKQDKLEEYRKTHNRDVLHIRYQNVSCALCDDYSNYVDSLRVYGIKNDTIYFFETVQGDLDLSYGQLHAIAIPESLKKDTDFRDYYEAFGDSLQEQAKDLHNELVEYFNSDQFTKYVDQLTKEAPYGYFNEWGWSNKYGMLTFNCQYTNLNKSTIKYIDVYFSLYNDVDDFRGSGHFQGTGPVEQYASGSWDWDSSSYFPAGDTSSMTLTKLILTFRNGTKKVLTKNQIVCN